MLKAIINVNGELKKPEEARVSVYDRSFLFGDSLYEVIRTYHGRFFGLGEHLVRLGRSAELCRFRLAQPLSFYQTECEKTLRVFLEQNPGSEAYCRIILSRGRGKIGFGLENLETGPQFVIIVQPLEAPTSEKWEKGYSFEIAPHRIRNDRRATDPAAKTGNYLNSLLAFLEAAERGFEDALLCNADGHLTEGTTFNIFYVRNEIIATPPLDIGILDGITRRHAISIARGLGYEVREVRFSKEHLIGADEVFMTSSIKEVFPVTKIDGKIIARGKPGPVTRALFSAWKAQIESVASNSKNPLARS